MIKSICCLMILCGTVLLSGCASLARMEATEAAINNNLIEGVSSTNKFYSIPWKFPGQPWGRVYSDIGGVESWITEGPLKGRYVVFFLGKSRVSKEWEVFATQMWGDGKYEVLPVKLPEYKKKN